ncbi:MAG: Rv1355c family protein, partial [Myxococcales bacterium]|nr:Rv1355c family protein [Myxococcales bacterium]
GRLVHVLPELEYRELRTSRNRNKITFEEQEILRRLRIGIVGLSIGQAAAITLTLEEVGGLLALADFDVLEVSNMNRLRAGVHGIGVNKAVLAAREIYEINPYANVEVWSQGIDRENIDAFLHAGGQKLDLLYEECDDLQMKLLVREHAREARIPVLMETSDRGLIDVERFDLEPDRPIFHGLTGGVRAEALGAMSTSEKVPLVMQIIGRLGMSDRMAASMVDIETTLKSWPQLASEVALGAGINVDVARRIALGQFSSSGRFYVDLEGIISDERVEPVMEPASYAIEICEEARHFELPPLQVLRSMPSEAEIRALVTWGMTAFSGGNCQPWSFEYSRGRLVCVHEVDRSRSMLDVENRASHLAFGSLIETLSLAAGAMNLEARPTLFPEGQGSTRICDLELEPRSGGPVLEPLVMDIPNRVTNRQLGRREPLDPAHRVALMDAARGRGCALQIVEEPEKLEAIGALLGAGDRVRLLSKVLHGEMMNEVRWNKEEVERTRDGLDVATLEMTPADLAGMRMISSWPVMKMVGAVGGGIGLERPTRKAIAASSAVGLLTVEGLSPRSFVEAGRMLQRIWLKAGALGLAFQPMTPITYLFYRLEHADGEGLSAKDRAALTALRGRYRALFDVPAGHAEPMLFRLSRAEPPTARSIRRHVDDALRFSA